MSGIFCQKCGAPGHENDIFCRKCGAKHQADIKVRDGAPEDSVKFCANCGSPMRSGANFCDNCGSEGGRREAAQKQSPESRSGARMRPIYALALLFLFALGAAVFLDVFSEKIDFAKIMSSIKRQTQNESDISDGASHPGDEISPDDTERASGEEAPGGLEPYDPEETDISEILTETDETVEIRPSSDDTPPLFSNTQELPNPDTETISGEHAVPPARSEDDLPKSPEYVWSKRDVSGYSTLVPLDRFFTSSQTPYVKGEVSGDRVRIRARHSLKGRIIDQFDTGASFDVLRRYSSEQEKFCWYEVQSGDVTGWIYGEFLNVPGVMYDPPQTPSEDVRQIITSPAEGSP